MLSDGTHNGSPLYNARELTCACATGAGKHMQDVHIRLFPEKFWFDAALAISFFTLVGGAIFTVIGWLALPRAAFPHQRNHESVALYVGSMNGF